MSQWTGPAIAKLCELAADPFLTWKQIGAVLERAPDSCHCAYKNACRRKGVKPTPRKRPVQDAAPKVSIAEAGSELLKQRMIEQFRRFANDNRISTDEARCILMGERQHHAVPGTETYLKTSAMRRLAA